MSDIAIRVENLGKMYHIGKARERHDTLRDALMGALRAPRQWFGRNGQGSEEEAFWALKDVSFEVKRGEVVGVIGRNGAGKSTLLKILSRITEPTTGRAEIHGRVGSLLEVGTGFHPELTGRENIYLNGAILGMRKTEIDAKFDEIVDFSGVERFLETPVKRYSSGMYVRLAFAVAAHLEPEILLVDEVLSVGDAEFQKKCLGKMGDVAREGRTVLFVSHNMGAVGQLCSRALVLDEGKVCIDSIAAQAIQVYLKQTLQRVDQAEIMLDRRIGDAFFRRVAVLGFDGHPCNMLSIAEPFSIELDYQLLHEFHDLEVSFEVFNDRAVKVFASHRSVGQENSTEYSGPGTYHSSAILPAMFLVPGYYTVTIGLHQPNVQAFDLHEHILSFQIVDSGSHIAKYSGADVGEVLVFFSWKTEKCG